MSLVTALDGPILGRYRPLSGLGGGATSIVVLAEDLTSGREVAVKLVFPEPDLIDRARTEIAAMSRLKHPNIPDLLDFGHHAGSLAIVLEAAPGRSVDEVWAAKPPRGRAVLDTVCQTLDALAHAHKRGIVHRDVKPANVMVDAHGTVQLIDFGIAHINDRAALTVVGDLIGTIAYMAPEQARGEPATPASDVWSAALLAYEGLAGEHPLLGRSPRETHERVCRGRVPRLATLRPRIPPAIEAAVHCGLERRPEDRPRASELAKELASAAPVSHTRHRTAITATTAGLAMVSVVSGAPALAVLAGLGGIWALSSHAPRRS